MEQFLLQIVDGVNIFLVLTGFGMLFLLIGLALHFCNKD